jgi:hypothetical protein
VGAQFLGANMQEIPFIRGEEYDVLTRWRRHINCRHGRARLAKNTYRRRCRRAAKAAADWDAFNAALDNPEPPNNELKELLAERAPWDLT